jgi:hypothetical protein
VIVLYLQHIHIGSYNIFMSIIMTHRAIFVGKAGTDYQDKRNSLSCNLRIDEVNGQVSAVLMSSRPKYLHKNVNKLSSLGKLEYFDIVVFSPIVSKTTLCDVYVVEFVDYKKRVDKNDLKLGPNIEERLEVKLSGGWTIDVGNRDKFAGMLVGFGEPFPSDKDLTSIRREIKLGGLFD